MGWFDGFRDQGRNTYYSSRRIAVWADVKQVVVIGVCSVVVIALLIVVCGTRGKERLTTFIRAAFTLHTGIFVLLTIHSQDWLVTHGNTHCPYMAHQQHDISAYVTISVGLRSLNITLRADPNDTYNSEIQYNEEFKFVGVHEMHYELVRAKQYGLPDTILYIVEYYSADYGHLKWCRHLRVAGRYTGILLWTTFAMWCTYNIVLCFVVFYGAVLMTIAGLTMLCACAIFHFLQPPMPLTIPLDDVYAKFQYGWCLYVVLVSGSVTSLTGLLLMILCHFAPIGTSKVFLLDVSDLEEDDPDSPLTEHPTVSTVTGPSRRNPPLSKSRSMTQAYVNNGFQGDSPGGAACCSSAVTDREQPRSRQYHTKRRRESSLLESGSDSGSDCIVLPAITTSRSNHLCDGDSRHEGSSGEKAARQNGKQPEVPQVVVSRK